MQRNKHHRIVITIAAAAMILVGLQGCGNSDEGSQPIPPSALKCGSSALFQNSHEACSAMDVKGEGACLCFMGYAWNGSACQGVTGCECKGADCDKLAETLDVCEAEHKTCSTSYKCGSPALTQLKHEVCGGMDAKGDGQCYCMMGYAWNGTACVGITGCECKGQDCGKLSSTLQQCEAQHNSCDKPIQCGSTMLTSLRHDSCAAMDVKGEGACDCMLGYAWDGKSCVAVAGCECKGLDCTKLSETMDACKAAHPNCSQ